ncbi:MAG TPA: cytochrome P460 family protein [Bryobacteraceae bacterium]|nr:cytochrome P460 family protein [Bryobacteraceae bacterium]
MRTSILAAALLAATLLIAEDHTSTSDQPEFNAKGELLFPANYREWIFLSSGLGMNYGPLAATAAEDPRFDNVFAAPSAYRAFMKTGRWPDKTVLLIEVRAASSKGSINKAGHFQSGLAGIEAEVKDEVRFPTKWAFFSFGKGDAAGRLRPAKEGCYSCHAQNGAVDHTFVQFYPTLLSVATEKGTLKVQP